MRPNGTPGEIRTHTILILSQTPHASWATGAYRWVCATTLALLGCPPASYSHSVWDATKVLSLPLLKILDFYQAPRSLPDYYCLTPPIVLAAVFHQLRFTLAEVNQLDGCQSGTRTHDPLINSQMLPPTELSGTVTRQQVPFLKPVGSLPN